MVVALVTKGPLLHADDAKLNPGMDYFDNPALAGDIVPNSVDDVFDDVPDEQRSKKIALLKKAVADGTYQVSHERLADRLIEHMLEPKG